MRFTLSELPGKVKLPARLNSSRIPSLLDLFVAFSIGIRY
jgi:hypothetical protein